MTGRESSLLLDVPFMGLPGRFWEKVLLPTVERGCWDWTGSLTKGGYGRFVAGNGDTAVSHGRIVLAHRLVLQAKLGRELVRGEAALHRCDRPCCVNPDHIWLGSQLENIADRNAKGRQARQKGEAHGRSKLTDAAVVAIRSDPRPQTQIAAEYGVGQTIISQVKRRESWRHVP